MRGDGGNAEKKGPVVDVFGGLVEESVGLFGEDVD